MEQKTRVTVTMSAQCARALKVFASELGVTPGEFLYNCTRHHMHTMAKHCERPQAVLDMCGIKLDPRINKNCFGTTCHTCAHKKECTAGRAPDASWEWDTARLGEEPEHGPEFEAPCK